MLDKEILYQLKSEILKSDYNAYIKDGRHYDLANKFNDTLITIDEPVSIATLNSFADTYGLLVDIEDAILDEKYSSDVKRACRQILRVFSGRYPSVDLTLPTVKNIFMVLVDANILTQDIVNAIFNLGKTKISLSIYKFGSLISSIDIAEAINLP